MFRCDEMTPQILEEVDELAYRFPELDDIEVIEHINYVCKPQPLIPYDDDYMITRAILGRYNRKAAEALKEPYYG